MVDTCLIALALCVPDNSGMANDQLPTRVEVNLSKGKLRADNVWDDILPAVKPGVSTLGNLLGVAANATGLTAEFFNDVINNLRKLYREGVFNIPEEHRRRPPFRITSAVLIETVNCVEESGLHKLFANLLVTASDSRTVDNAHPGFASTISQLTPFDAKVIVALLAHRGLNHAVATQAWPNDHASFDLSCENLCRLGIAEWEYQRLDGFFERHATDGFKQVGSSRQIGVYRDDDAEMYARAAEKLAKTTFAEIEKSRKRSDIVLTDFGKLFAKACFTHAKPRTETPPQ
jgi:hypothetical protein